MSCYKGRGGWVIAKFQRWAQEPWNFAPPRVLCVRRVSGEQRADVAIPIDKAALLAECRYSAGFVATLRGQNYKIIRSTCATQANPKVRQLNGEAGAEGGETRGCPQWLATTRPLRACC